LLANDSFRKARLSFSKHVLLHLNIDKGPKYREPKSINWKHNFKILMDSVEDYARQWAKREKKNDIAQVNVILCWQMTVLERHVCLFHLS
jgi:hypothetical protein